MLFGASLIALKKKDGGIRPIAVGLTLRCQVAKVLCSKVLHTMGEYLSPLQLAFGTAGGEEAAVHAARHFLQNSPNDHLLLKLDFENTFNCLRCDKMLETVLQSAPLLFPFAYSEK